MTLGAQTHPDVFAALPILSVPLDLSTLDIPTIAEIWFAQFKRTLEQLHDTPNPAVAGYLTRILTIKPTPWWKDHLSLTWSLRTMRSASMILAMLRVTLPLRRPTSFSLTSSTFVTAAPGVSFIQTGFVFATDVATCSGMASLVPDETGAWKAWVIFTRMEELVGEESDVSRLDVPDEMDVTTADAADVLIVGAGQNGLQLGAALRTLKVSNIIVERESSIGENWLGRYDALRLHTSKWNSRFAYREFPPSLQRHPSHSEIASFLRFYAQSTHLNVLTSTQVTKADFDDTAQEWKIQLIRDDGQMRTIRVHHLVMATGMTGRGPVVPVLPGQEVYKGTVIHSSLFKNGSEWHHRRAVVIGTGTSGHDIANDLYDHGAQVTMIQRSPTMVLSLEYLQSIHDPFFNEHLPLSVADPIWESMPVPLTKALSRLLPVSDFTKATEVALDKAGFRLKEVDHVEAVYNRGGGLYVDVGASSLIIAGKIAIKSDSPIVAFTDEGLEFADHSCLNADLIVFATGYNLQNMRDTIRTIVGEEIGGSLKQVWGLDEEGHTIGAYRDSGHPRIWYSAGDFAMARYYSKVLALQIKATDLGLLHRPFIDTTVDSPFPNPYPN